MKQLLKKKHIFNQALVVGLFAISGQLLAQEFSQERSVSTAQDFGCVVVRNTLWEEAAFVKEIKRSFEKEDDGLHDGVVNPIADAVFREAFFIDFDNLITEFNNKIRDGAAIQYVEPFLLPDGQLRKRTYIDPALFSTEWKISLAVNDIDLLFFDNKNSLKNPENIHYVVLNVPRAETIILFDRTKNKPFNPFLREFQISFPQIIATSGHNIQYVQNYFDAVGVLITSDLSEAKQKAWDLTNHDCLNRFYRKLSSKSLDFHSPETVLERNRQNQSILSATLK